MTIETQAPTTAEVNAKMEAAARDCAAGSLNANLASSMIPYDPAEHKRREDRYEAQEVLKKKLDIFGAILNCRPGLDPEAAADAAAQVYEKLK